MARKTSVSISPVLEKIKKVTSTQILYLALIVLVFAVGYLFAKVQMLEKGSGSTLLGNTETVQQQPAGSAPQEAPVIVDDLDTGHFPVKGDENAPVTIVEFSDFECPYCEQFYNNTLSTLIKEYIDTGKAKLYYRHYPLTFHPSAQKLAVASECANEQGMFWQMHDKIFTNQAAGDFADDTLASWAGDLGMNTASFSTCLNSGKYDDTIQQDISDGTVAGVSGTPTFFVNGERLVGAQPIEAFRTLIDSKL